MKCCYFLHIMCKILLLWSLLSSTVGFQGEISVPPGAPGAILGVDVADPDFAGPIQNVTVAVGREAVLSCSVTELGHYKVGWMKAEDQTILTLHTRVVTHNSRISVTHDNFRTWQLRIRQLKLSDRGCYMCQINTNTMKKQIGCIDVHVPPDIDDDGTSGDVTVTEGGNATLTCRAAGRPPPRIQWRREDGDHLVLRKNNRDVVKVDTYSGNPLTLVKLDRKQMGAYLCIASNDVPPAVSKRILLNVQFAPSIKVPNQLLGAPLNTDMQLECFVEAFPNTVNYWIKSHNEMLLNGTKHIMTEERTGYHVHMMLTIRDFSRNDIGPYMCVSVNSLGRADGTIRTYVIKIITTTPTTTTIRTTTTTTTTTTPEPTTQLESEFDVRNIKFSTTYSPLENFIEDPVLDNSLAPSAFPDHREYSANYASRSSDLIADLWQTLLLSLCVLTLMR